MRKSAIEDVLPLSSLQEGLLFHALYEEDGPDVYTVQLAVEMRGPLDAERLHSAAEALLHRHPNLRAYFRHKDLDTPLQVIRRQVRTPWREADLIGRGDQAEAAYAALADEERSRRFNMARPPLLRFVLVRLPGERFRLLVTLHHIVVDGWSVPVLLDDLFELYERAGNDTGMRRVTPYRDYLTWLSHQDRETGLATWKTELAGLTEPTLLSTTHHHANTAIPHSLEIELTTELTNQLTTTARHHNWTLNTLIQAAWGLTLGHLLDRHDIVFGGTVSGRPPELPGIETMVGLLINTLPVRVTWQHTDHLTTLLTTLQNHQTALTTHQHLQLADIQAQTGHTQLFDTTTVFENYPTGAADAPQLVDGLHITGMDARDATHYAITLLALPQERLRFRIDHRPDVLDRATVNRLADWLQRILATIADNPDQPVSGIDLLDRAERRRMLADWNGADRPLPGLTLTELLEAQGLRAPEAVAVLSEGVPTSFAELHADANRLARALIARGAGPERPVAVCLHRGRELMVSLLAVLKTGSPYLPVDPELPADRIGLMLDSATPVCLVADSRTSDSLTASAEVKPLLLDDRLTVRELQERSDLPIADSDRAAPLDPSQLAYIIYTSGSTGVPKGVGVPHSGIVNRLLWMQDRYRLDAGDRVLQKTPIGFDVSVWELFWPLLAGAGLVMARPGGHRDPAYLAEEIARHRVTTVHFVPSMLDAFLQEPSAARCSGVLRRVICSGEALSVATQDRALELLGAPLHNLYGPTEASVDVTHWDCRADGQPVPIGRPIWNTRTHVLDSALRMVPHGVTGELYLAGAGLARGYTARAALTAERFVPDPHGAPGTRMYRTGDLARWREDGALEYLGRTDDQVKIRGLRIELGEIEAVLAAVPGVAQIRAAVHRSGAGEQYLVAYAVPDAASDVPLEADRLRAAAAAALPGYMVPAAFVVLDALPITVNGKLDQQALPAPGFTSGGAQRAPRTATERLLCSIFAEVLGRDRVGPEDSFFELGGHSLSAARLVNRIRSELGGDLPVRAVFATPTPAALALLLANPQSLARGMDPMLELRPGGDLPPLFCFPPGAGLSWCYAGLLGGLDPRQPVFGLQSPGLTGKASPDTLGAMAEDLVERLLRVRPHGPYRLLGWSAGGHLAHEAAVLLQERGEVVEQLVILDAYPIEPTDDATGPSREEVFAEAFGPSLADPGDPDTYAHALELVRAELGGLGEPGRLQDSTAGAVLETYLRNTRAMLEFRPRLYRGDLLFFRASDWTVDARRDLTRWQPYVSGKIELHQLAVGHAEISRPDILSAVAEVIARTIPKS